MPCWAQAGVDGFHSVCLSKGKRAVVGKNAPCMPLTVDLVPFLVVPWMSSMVTPL